MGESRAVCIGFSSGVSGGISHGRPGLPTMTQVWSRSQRNKEKKDGKDKRDERDERDGCSATRGLGGHDIHPIGCSEFGLELFGQRLCATKVAHNSKGGRAAACHKR